jgi:MFS family permease
MTTLGTPLAQPAPDGDLAHLRPPVREAVATGTRVTLTLAAGTAGIAAAAVAAPTGEAALAAAVVGAGLLTSIAANWSTCGMSVAGVVAAPKQAERRGASTPVRRLGWHALGSILTGAPTGALIGAAGILAAPVITLSWAVGVWALAALLYGLHELGAIRMPTPMRRRQLPRHLRRTTEPWKVSFLFGAIIGPGFLIFIRSSAYYLLVLGLLLAGNPLLGALLFTIVSLGRCLPSVAAILHTRAGGSMPGFLAVMCLVDRRVQVVTGAGLVGLATFAAASTLL